MLRIALALGLAFLGCGDDGGSEPGADAAGGPAIDAAPELDADPGQTPGQIACGDGMFCTSPAEVCCGDADSQACTATDACDSDFSFACDGPEDCGGGMQGCCVVDTGASCVAAMDCEGALLCEDDDDCPDSTCGQIKICLP